MPETRLSTLKKKNEELMSTLHKAHYIISTLQDDVDELLSENSFLRGEYYKQFNLHNHLKQYLELYLKVCNTLSIEC